MLFDIGPKERRSDLFDRKKELSEMSEAVARGERLIVVYGIRRIGKTSLLRSFLADNEFLSVFLDIRKIYYMHRKAIPAGVVYERLLAGFTELLNNLGVSPEDQIQILSASQSFDITDLLSSIDKWCSKRGARFLFVLDEAQYLRSSRKVVYDGVIAWSIDNLKNITFILSGSEVGVLKDMLNYEDIKAPLYGRLKNEIVLRRLNPEESKVFLERGFKEAGQPIKGEEIRDVIEKIGGMIGWLVYYGYYRTVKRMGHETAVSEVFKEGSKISMSEVEEAVKGSKKRYTAILIAVAKGIATWGDIKAYVVIKTGDITDGVFDKLLSSLIKFSIVEKNERGQYGIVDPVLRNYLAERNEKGKL